MKIEEIKKYKRLLHRSIPLLIPIFIYLFIYTPFHRKTVQLSKEYKKYMDLTRELEIDYLTPEININNFYQKTIELEKKFFTSDSEAIKNISKLCHGLGIELSSISPSNKEKLTFTFGNKNISKIIFKISLQSNFLNLVKLLEKIDKEEKLLVLNNLTLVKSSPLDTVSDNLRVNLELHAFILDS